MRITDLFPVQSAACFVLIRTLTKNVQISLSYAFYRIIYIELNL